MTDIRILTPELAKEIEKTPEKSRVAVLAPLDKNGTPHLCSRWSKPFIGHFDEVIHFPVQAIPEQGNGYDPYIADAFKSMDGMLLPGGHSNVHPSFYKPYVTEENDLYDEARDHFAFHMIGLAIENQTPGLFICRGMQELGVYYKMQLELLEAGEFDHAKGYIHDGNHELMDDLVHDITICKGGLLAKVFDEITRPVNSIHRYGFPPQPTDLRIEAVAPDGVIEAFSTHDDLLLGFQPHPEFNFGEGRNYWHNGIFGERIAKFKEKYKERTGNAISPIPELAPH